MGQPPDSRGRQQSIQPADASAAATAACPVAGTPYSWVIMDPDGDTINNDIRLQTDSNPPDGILGGVAATSEMKTSRCSYDPADQAASRSSTTTLAVAATVRTDAVIEDLLFVFKDANHAPTVNPANVIYVETQITVRTRTINPSPGSRKPAC